MELANNKKALFDYHILEKMEAGLVLTGPEVKAVRNGQISLKGAFISFHNGNAYLTGANISRYQPAGKQPDYDPEKSRRLVLHKREIGYLQGKSQVAGLTVVPLSVYTKNRFIKLEVAVAKGKKEFDKRETIKKRDVDKEMRRAIKGI